MLTGIQNIKITDLYPHQKNPRRDLGDLTELAESIKARGVLQNLTVVPHVSQKGLKLTGYLIVIGHRRVEAAKLAGLTELPCVIAEMDEKTQISTMLLENMQRCDLTMVEQAEGIQMMIDLGGSVKSVSERTGLSETTVRRRVKMLETFGRDALESVQGRPIKIEDYESLYKINKKKSRETLFKLLGTPNFDYQIKQELENQEREERQKKAVVLMKNVANKGTYEEANKGTMLWRAYNYISAKDLEELEKKVESLKESVEHYWFDDSKNWKGMGLYTKEKQKVEKPKETKQEKERKARIAALKEAFSIAYELRLAFVQQFSVTTKSLLAVEAMAIDALFFGDYLREDTFRDYAGIKEKFRNSWDKTEKGDSFAEAAAKVFTEKFTGKQSANALVVGAFCRFDASGFSTYDTYDGKYRPNEKLSKLYSHIVQLGYEMSDDEIALLDGTHKLFYKPPEKKKTDPKEEQKCRVCGCTENNACPGGCSWVEDDLCSACVDQEPGDEDSDDVGSCDPCLAAREKCDKCCWVCQKFCKDMQKCTNSKQAMINEGGA